MTDDAMKAWLDDFIEYLQDNEFKIEADDDGDLFMTNPDIGLTRIFIDERANGVVLKVFGDGSIFGNDDKYEILNLSNQMGSIARVALSKDQMVASYTMFVPHLARPDAWLYLLIADFIDEVTHIHKTLIG